MEATVCSSIFSGSQEMWDKHETPVSKCVKWLYGVALAVWLARVHTEPQVSHEKTVLEEP
jgi:hypothetical protein